MNIAGKTLEMLLVGAPEKIARGIRNLRNNLGWKRVTAARFKNGALSPRELAEINEAADAPNDLTPIGAIPTEPFTPPRLLPGSGLASGKRATASTTPTSDPAGDRNDIAALKSKLAQVESERDSFKRERDEALADAARIRADVERRAEHRAMEINASLGVPPLKKDTWVEAGEKGLIQTWEEEQDPKKKTALWERIKKEMGLK